LRLGQRERNLQTENNNASLFQCISLPHTATCIIIAPRRLKLRLSGSARKSQKRFRDTPRFKFRAVLARTQPFFITQREKRGDQSRFKCRKMVNYNAFPCLILVIVPSLLAKGRFPSKNGHHTERFSFRTFQFRFRDWPLLRHRLPDARAECLRRGRCMRRAEGAYGILWIHPLLNPRVFPLSQLRAKRAARTYRENVPFLSAFPMFVPSLSW
jgi:hypothetical protein